MGAVGGAVPLKRFDVGVGGGQMSASGSAIPARSHAAANAVTVIAKSA